MIKDLYLFTNGVVMVFDDDAKQRPELQGLLTDELKQRLVDEFKDGTRITFSRWKEGFFELTREEFMVAEIEGNLLVLRFATGGSVEGDEANRSH